MKCVVDTNRWQMFVSKSAFRKCVQTQLLMPNIWHLMANGQSQPVSHTVPIWLMGLLTCFLCGCATSRYPQHITDAVQNSVKTVSISPAIFFPPELTVPKPNYSASGSGIIGALAVVALDATMNAHQKNKTKRLNDNLRSQVDINAFISKRMLAEMTSVMNTGTCFRLAANADTADAEFVFIVESYGAEPWQKFISMGNRVFMTTSVMLIGHPPYSLKRINEKDFLFEPEDMTRNPVLWERTITSTGPDRKVGEAALFEASVTNDYVTVITNIAAVISAALNERTER